MTTDSTEARLRAVLGDDPEPGDGAAWAAGFGIVAPEVTRYTEVLRDTPDAIELAMRNLAAIDGLPVLDPTATTLLSLLTHAQRPLRVLEVGTGIGLVTTTLARAVPIDCSITSIATDPVRQGQAHAFLERANITCATELRLGDPLRLLRESRMRTGWDLVVLTDPDLPRLELLDMVAPSMDEGSLLVMPFALRGGRVAHGSTGWDEATDVQQQRACNRAVAMDLRFTDVNLLPVGDGLLLARRRSGVFTGI